MTKPIFREVQRLRHPWIWLIILGVAGLIWYAFITQFVFQRPFGTNPMPPPLLFIFWLIFGLGLPWFGLASRLITEVRADGLYVRWFPLHVSFRRFTPDQLKACYVRTYHPLWEYGGWGLRYGFKGRAYNISGNRGVQLELSDGKRLLIGSQHPEELLQAIESMKRQ